METNSMTLTLREFAKSVIDDPEYRATVTARARAGNLTEEIELWLLETAEGRMTPKSAECVQAPTQSRSFAVVRPLASVACIEEEEQP
jgi:hypothetical protein